MTFLFCFVLNGVALVKGSTARMVGVGSYYRVIFILSLYSLGRRYSTYIEIDVHHGLGD